MADLRFVAGGLNAVRLKDVACQILEKMDLGYFLPCVFDLMFIESCVTWISCITFRCSNTKVNLQITPTKVICLIKIVVNCISSIPMCHILGLHQ